MRRRIQDAAVGGYTKIQNAERVHKYSWAAHHKSDQDRHVFEPEAGLFAVADGVGGSPNGAWAAEVACESFIDLMPRDARAQDVLDAIEADIYREMNERVARTESQTTFTGCALTQDGFMVYLHAGDSRLLRLRGNRILESDIVTSQHNSFDPRRLTNALGNRQRQLTQEPDSHAYSEAEWGRRQLMGGDRLVLATDGVGRTNLTHEDDENEWWHYYLVRRIGETAMDCVKELLNESNIVDDAQVIVIDIK